MPLLNHLKDALSITPNNYQTFGLFDLLNKFKLLNGGVGARLKCKSYDNGNLDGLQTNEEIQKLGASLICRQIPKKDHLRFKFGTRSRLKCSIHL